MPRLTITLTEDMYHALKEIAVSRKRSISAIIEESLRLYGILPNSPARTLVEAARETAAMSEDEALRLAVAETWRKRST